MRSVAWVGSSAHDNHDQSFLFPHGGGIANLLPLPHGIFQLSFNATAFLSLETLIVLFPFYLLSFFLSFAKLEVS